MTCSTPDCKHPADFIQVDAWERRMTIVCAAHKTGSWTYRVPFRTDEEGATYRNETKQFHLDVSN